MEVDVKKLAAEIIRECAPDMLRVIADQEEYGKRIDDEDNEAVRTAAEIIAKHLRTD